MEGVFINVFLMVLETSGTEATWLRNSASCTVRLRHTVLPERKRSEIHVCIFEYYLKT
jgi:hypothetical protein